MSNSPGPRSFLYGPRRPPVKRPVERELTINLDFEGRLKNFCGAIADLYADTHFSGDGIYPHENGAAGQVGAIHDLDCQHYGNRGFIVSDGKNKAFVTFHQHLGKLIKREMPAGSKTEVLVAPWTYSIYWREREA